MGEMSPYVASPTLEGQSNKRINLTRPTVSVVTSDRSPRSLSAVR